MRLNNKYYILDSYNIINMNINFNKKDVVFYLRKYLPFIIFFLLLLFLHIFMHFRCDDIFFSNRIQDNNFLGFISGRYQYWSSRIVIETILVLMTKSMVIWAIVDTLLTTIGIYYLIKLVNANDKKIVQYGLLLFLMYPLCDLSSAGWIATTLNYSWCFACGMISFIPLIKSYCNEKTNLFFYIIAIFGIIFATNQEQSCALIFGFNLLYLLNIIIKKEKINKYNILALVLSLISLLFILTCPGNALRFSAEIINWYPEFANFGILQKIYLGIIPTVGILLRDKLIFLIFYVLANMTLLYKVKNKNLKYILYLNIIFILALTIFKPILLNCFPGFEKPFSILMSSEIPHGQIKATLVAVTISFYLLLSSCLMLYKVFSKNLFPMIVFIAGFMSRFIMGFSPTIFASGTRTMFFFYMALILLALMLINKLLEENLIDGRKNTIINIIFIAFALLNYINVFNLLN